MLVSLVVVPLALAFVLALTGKRIGRAAQVLAATASLYNTVICVIALQRIPIYETVGSWNAFLGIELFADSLALLLVLASSVLILAAVCYSAGGGSVDPKYLVLIVILLAGLSGWSLTRDLFNMYVFIEIVSVISYSLVAYQRTPQSLEAAFKYIVFGSLAGVMIFGAVLVSYFHSGHLNMGLALPQAAGMTPAVQSVFWGLLITGFLGKAGLAPLHMWLPDAHSSAPSAVSGLLSGIVVKLNLYSLYRILTFAATRAAMQALIAIGALSIVVGHLMALRQTDIKRLLAYSSVAQLGYIALGLASFQAAAGALLHIFNHAALKSALFMAVGVLIAGSGSRYIKDLQGTGRLNLQAGIVFTLAVIGIVGIPPLGAFTSKWYIVRGLVADKPLWACFVPAGTVAAAAYYLPILETIWDRPTSGNARRASRLTRGTLVSLAVLIGLLSLSAPQLYQMLRGG